MGLFDLIAEILQAWIDLIPRVHRRNSSNQWCVVDPFCGRPHQPLSRPILYWPVGDEICHYPKNDIPVDCQVQTLTTADGGTITVNPEFSFRIVDPVVMRQSWGENYAEHVTMRVRSVVEEWHTGHNRSQIQDFEHYELVEDIEDDLLEFGVEITHFCVEERCDTSAQRLFGVEFPVPEE